jgi:hypothetical protein
VYHIEPVIIAAVSPWYLLFEDWQDLRGKQTHLSWQRVLLSVVFVGRVPYVAVLLMNFPRTARQTRGVYVGDRQYASK